MRTSCLPALWTKLALATLAVVSLAGLPDRACWAADPTVSDALKLSPVQKSDVDYDQPEPSEAAQCELKGHSAGNVSGWLVYSPSQQLLRRFLDTNGDGKVDQWCYYKNGVEVYRDVDGDYNGKADQFRWMGTAGIRWGVDQDEDGEIDRWRVISPEEVTAETVAAIRSRDVDRFKRLLPTAAELEALGLSDEQQEDIAERIEAAINEFATLAGAQTTVTADSQWIHFGGSQPGVIPAGTNENHKDIYVYDNVSAVVAQSDGDHAQVAIGTLVQVDRTWRLIDLPSALDKTQIARGGYFFQEMLSRDLASAQAQAGAISPQMQKLISELSDIDKQIEDARTTASKARLNEQRADLLLDIVKLAPNSEDRSIWIQQFADTVGAAVQAGAFPDGLEHLRKLKETALKPSETEHAAHVEFVMLTSTYGLGMLDSKADHEKIHQQWLEGLAQFVKRYPDAQDAPEAMLQLGFAEEFAGNNEEAIEYYTSIVDRFPAAHVTPKAEGAKRRLESIGKPLQLQAKTADGRPFDVASLKGKVVLVHYWAQWWDKDLETIRKLKAKYGSKFAPVGISCDASVAELKAAIDKHRLSWPQLFEPGGMDSRLANQLGVMSLPAMLLLDENGRVINNNIHVSELEDELEKRLR